jgi:nanoRNase/pAp phosphatase (c-di-AMP/oligoRNAs hydrolase)
MAYIVGHVSPDWDCIAALWLLQRFGGFEETRIR